MTPKEKAIILVNNFGFNSDYITLISPSKHAAKHYALTAVEEYLSFQEHLFITDGSVAYKYWQEVKQEIEKL